MDPIIGDPRQGERTRSLRADPLTGRFRAASWTEGYEMAEKMRRERHLEYSKRGSRYRVLEDTDGLAVGETQ